jgi:ribosomal protein S18 acetylase RimI-like enzyme
MLIKVWNEILKSFDPLSSINEEKLNNYLKIQGDQTDTSKDWLIAVDKYGMIKGFALLFKCSKFKYWWLELEIVPEFFSTEIAVKLFEEIMEIARKQKHKDIKFSLINKYFVKSFLELKFNELGLKPIQYEFWMRLEDFSSIPLIKEPIGINFQKYSKLENYKSYVDILNDAFSKAFDYEIFSTEDYKSIIEVNWREYKVEYWFAEEDNKPIGFCTVIIKPPIEHKGIIMTLAIYHSYHRKGIGSYLLGLGINTLIEKGCNIIELGVEAKNSKALALYKKFGFREIESQTIIDFVYSP